MTSVFAKRMRLNSADFRFQSVFGGKICRKSALRSGILFASTGVIHRLQVEKNASCDEVR